MSEQKLSRPPSFLLAFRDSPSFEIVFPSHSSKIESPQTPPFMLPDAWAESCVSFVQLVFQPQTEPSRGPLFCLDLFLFSDGASK